jgi:2',3'-cyclic-nucleotide 2'-phosphodiesterase (5'-nucleotidase family)
MQRKTNADIPYLQTGNVRDNLPSGKVLARHIWNIMPFDNNMVLGKIPGKLIPDFVRGTRELNPDQLYSIVTIDFLVEGWRNSKNEAIRAFGQAMPLDGPYLRDVLLESFK